LRQYYFILAIAYAQWYYSSRQSILKKEPNAMINQTKLTAAVEIAKSRTNDPKWIKAIDKAAAALAAGQLFVTLLNGYALVTSENGTYHVTAKTCDCPARVAHCYHKCCYRLVEMIETETAPAAVPAPAPTPNAGILVKRERGGVRIDGWMV
jgi:hypothetical protein